jgi:hypothetical protein
MSISWPRTSSAARARRSEVGFEEQLRGGLSEIEAAPGDQIII